MQHDPRLLQAERYTRQMDRTQSDEFEELRVVSPHFARMFQQAALMSLRVEAAQPSTAKACGDHKFLG